jgi:single-stranded-DNA-specific exonuclease
LITPTITKRQTSHKVYQKLIQNNLTELQARIISNRVSDDSKADAIANPKLLHLDHPSKLKDIEKAVDRLIFSIQNNEIIGIETDHDCDGQTSHAIIYETLVKGFGLPESNIRSYIGHRMEEGYGLSLSLANRIINDNPKPHLIITADNGSSDETQIALLKLHGIDTIVTDHHAIPTNGPPKSAYAVLNPTQTECNYNDKYIAGCMVAWLFMAQTRSQLQKLSWPKLPDMKQLLDFVAVGTIADCVSMAESVNNRAVTKAGLAIITKTERTCWKTLQKLQEKPINSEYLGFTIGPLLNSDGRLSDAFSSVSFLLEENEDNAEKWVQYLSEQNESRKSIQKKLTETATAQAIELVSKNYNSLCIYINDGHAGVHGISASRIKEKFGRPTIIFSPKLNEPGIISGSARSINALNIKQALDIINTNNPELMNKYGGHSGAAGLTIERESFKTFRELFEEVTKSLLNTDDIGPVIYTDGLLDANQINETTINEINQLEPFGRGFEYPVFEIEAEIQSIKLVGKDRNHAQILLLLENGKLVKGIWFNCDEHIHEVTLNQTAVVIGSIFMSEYNGNSYITININHIKPE